MSKLFLSCRVPKLLILAGNSFIFALLKLPRIAWLSRFKGHGCTENEFKFTQPRSQAGYLLLFEGSSRREPGSEVANLSWSTFRVSEYPKTDPSLFSGVDRLDRDLTIGQMQGLYRRQFFWIFSFFNFSGVEFLRTVSKFWKGTRKSLSCVHVLQAETWPFGSFMS